MQKGKGPYASTYSHPWHRNALSPGKTAQEEGEKVTFKSISPRGKWKDLSFSRTLCAPFACHSWTKKELGGPLPCEMDSSQAESAHRTHVLELPRLLPPAEPAPQGPLPLELRLSLQRRLGSDLLREQ